MSQTFPRIHTRWTAVFAMYAAIAMSIALHVVLIRYSPSFHLGAMRERSHIPDDPPMKLEDVIHEEPEQYPELEKLIPADPNRVADIPAELENLDPEIDVTAIEEPVLPSDVPSATDASEAQPELASRESVYDSRQDILAISEDSLVEKIEAQPRQVIPVIPRIDQALDIVEPVEVSVADLARVVASANTGPYQGAGGPGGHGGGTSLGRLERKVIPPVIDLPPVEEPMAEEIGEPSQLLDEPMEEITDLKPVENLLGIQSFVYTSPSEPGMKYFRINIFRQGIEALPVIPKEFVFMQDCSQSMTNAKIKKCKEGLIAGLELLREEDVFNIMAFRESVELCFPEPMRASVVNRARARAFIDQMSARGKTDVYASLEELSKIRKYPERPLIAMLITDGRPTMGLIDSSDIIESYTQRNRGSSSVFTVGGGRRANKYLLDLLSYRNRGDSMVVELDEDIPAALERLARELRHPVLTDLSYRFTGLDESQIFPRSLTNLYIDRPLVLYGRTLGNSAQVAFQVVGNSGAKTHDMVFSLDLSQSLLGDQDIRQDWAHHMIYHLIGQYIEHREDAVLEILKAECARYGISVPYAYQLDTPVQR